MQQHLSLRLLPSEAADDSVIRQYIASALAVKAEAVTGFHLLKKSMDARGRQVWINLSLDAVVDEPFITRPVQKIILKDVTHAQRSVIIIGAGPAGLFAALKLIEHGIKPIILERGKNVRARRRDLAILNKEGKVNPESNYCFGEGGAGTYSDGKLYTRSNKRGNINRILNAFIQFGADEKIRYEAHPHIGTNKLPHIITAMREAIVAAGAQFHFEKKLTDLHIKKGNVVLAETQDGETFYGDAVILATGHSARDIFELLHRKQLTIHAKPFALGVRIEHPQNIIDSLQFHCDVRDPHLPPASYSLVEQVNGRGVFSFCMCPGGIIAPAATNPGELVVNGWSPSKRNNPFANSGMVVQVTEQEAFAYLTAEQQCCSADDPLLLMRFQQYIEQKAFAAGGGNMTAPAQRMVDFCNSTISTTLPACSYVPGLQSSLLGQVLPSFIYSSLQEGFKSFGRKMPTQNGRNYYTNEAIVVATESRTSSPVRIPRDPATLQHPQIKNLFPCGEGAGYAGGIVSAAMDGERVAEAVMLLVNAG